MVIYFNLLISQMRKLRYSDNQSNMLMIKQVVSDKNLNLVSLMHIFINLNSEHLTSFLRFQTNSSFLYFFITLIFTK